jgi:hypothetical protein
MTTWMTYLEVELRTFDMYVSGIIDSNSSRLLTAWVTSPLAGSSLNPNNAPVDGISA